MFIMIALCTSVDSAYNIHGRKGQEHWLRLSQYRRVYKSHRLLWPLMAGPEVATIRGVYCS